MPLHDLSEQGTLFECVDPLDDQLSGQPILYGSLRELIVAANGWADIRLAGARIVTAGEVELRRAEIEQLICDELNSG